MQKRVINEEKNMKNLLKFTIVFIIFIIIAGASSFYFPKRQESNNLKLPKQKNMKISSTVFDNNQFIPRKYTCDGDNINPPLLIHDVPQEAQSLVLIVDDPDAPMGTWTHWLLWNINPSTSLIEEGNIPQGAVEGLNDFGENSYGGPCPPTDTHRYHFKLYALDTILDIGPSSKKDDVEKAMVNHIIDWTELIGLYERQ